MTEQIGLQSVLDNRKFDSGVDSYLRGIDRMNRANAKASGQFASQWGQIGRSVAKASAAMGVALVASAAAAGAAVTKFTTDGVKKSIELESQISGIGAVLNKTAQEVVPLKDLIFNLALDRGLQVSATEAADAIELLARNGLSMTEIMDGAARSTVLLANSTGADFGKAADIATDSMAIFNIAADEMESAVNGITSVTTASKFSINDYALALAQGGGVASATGVEFEDFNTSLAAISPLFKSGSDAGTSYKTMLMRLTGTAGPANEKMKELGIITEEAGNRFFDANGNLKSMNDIALVLNGALDGLSEEQTNVALSTIFGSDAMRAAVGLAESGEVVYTDLSKAASELGVSIDDLARFADGGITAFEGLQAQMAQTDAAKSAADRNDNLKASFAALFDQIEAIQILIGDRFSPVIRKMVEALSAFVEQNATAVVEAFGKIAEVVGGVVEVFTHLATEGELLSSAEFGLGEETAAMADKFVSATLAVLDFGTMIKNTVTPAISGAVAAIVALSTTLWAALGPASKFVTDNMAAFQGALAGVGAVLAGAAISTAISAIGTAIAALLSPIGLLIVGAAALGAAWNTNWLGIRDKTIAAIDAVSAAIRPFVSLFRQFGQGALTEIWTFVNGTETSFTNLKLMWMFVKIAAQELFDSIVETVRTKATEWATVLMEWGAIAWGWIVPAALVGASKLAEYVGTLKAKIVEKLPEWKSTFLEWASSAWDWIKGAAVLAGLMLAGYVSTLKSKLAEKLPEWIETLRGWAEIAYSWIEDAGAEARTRLTTFVNDLKAKIVEKLPEWRERLTQWATVAWEWIKTAAVRAATELTSYVLSLKGKIAEKLPEWKAKLAEWATVAWEWIKTAAADAKPALADYVRDLKGKLAEKLPEWKTGFIDWTAATWEWIGEASPGAAGALAGYASDLIGYLAAELPGWIAGFLGWAAAAWEWIGNALPLAITAISDFVVGLISGMSAETGNIEDGTSEWVDAVIDWIIDDAIPEIGPAFVKLGTAMLTAMGKIGTALGKAFSEITQALTDAILGPDWQANGQQIIDDIKAGFTNKKNAILETMGDIADSVYDAFADIEWLQLGKDIIDGIIDGMDNLTDNLKKKAQSLAKALPGWMQTVLGISSPSRVFAEIGLNIVQGLALGIDSGREVLNAAVDWMTQRALAAGREITSAWASFTPGGTFAEAVSAYGDILKAIESAGGDTASQAQHQAGLRAQENLLNLIKQSGGNPTQLLDGFNINDILFGGEAAQERLAGVLQRAASGVVASAQQRLNTEMFELQREFDRRSRGKLLQPMIDTLNDQGAHLQRALSAALNPFQAVRRDDLSSDIKRFDEQIADLQARFIETGSDELRRQIELLVRQRQQSINGIDQLARDSVGMDVAGTQRSISLWTKVVELAKQAAAAGMDIASTFGGINLGDELTAGDLSWLSVIQENVNLQTKQALHEEFKLLQAMQGIQTDFAFSGMGAGFVARYKSGVLDPMLETVRQAVRFDEARLAAIQQYEGAAKRISDLQHKQNQLDFLREQMSLVDQIRSNGLDPAQILSGLNLGINASLDDLITAVGRATQAMIEKVQGDLQIASPSRVFFRMGQQVIAGLTQGIQSMAAAPVLALQRSVVPAGQVSQRTNIFNVGGNTIASGMDQAMFESRVVRIIEGAI